MHTEFSIGLGKTIFNSSVALLPLDEPNETEIALTERFNRVKNSGAWPEISLKNFLPRLRDKEINLAENRDVHSTLEFENYYNSRFPFSEHLELLGLEKFSTLKNDIPFINHHLAHAWSALAFSPFEECLLLVLDGAGTANDSSFELKSYEYLSLFQWKNRELKLLDKKYLQFQQSKNSNRTFSEGIGIFYETASEFIFNSKNESGKVMGLAPFGKSEGIQNSLVDYMDGLDWSKKFLNRGKINWEASENLDLYKNLAATVQENFEYFLFEYLNNVSIKHPTTKNLIFTGGCALNCTFNGKLAKKKLFEKIFIPSNPGDEGIGLGCAFSYYFEKYSLKWSPTAWNKLTSYRGIKKSIPTDLQIENAFCDYMVEKPRNLIEETAKLLAKGEIIAFFQGRSEVGPRSLGNRSILASPVQNNLKNYLNEHIKFREEFRPYGCTVPWELSHIYFDVEPGFENPFMSFAVPVREKFCEQLKDLSHVDGTSRIQTLHFEQNSLFHSILAEVGRLTGLPILLNTSLNVMNEPIVESIDDAKRFLESSNVCILVIGDYIIKKH